MRFKITRTSSDSDKEKPTDKIELTKEKYKDRWGYDCFEWIAEIKNLKELINFIEKEDILIIISTGYKRDKEKKQYRIEIYDDYRE